LGASITGLDLPSLIAEDGEVIFTQYVHVCSLMDFCRL
jgi:hypothetical protein